jgi:hypothetical protein
VLTNRAFGTVFAHFLYEIKRVDTNFTAQELEILEYLKSWGGRYVSLVDICRSAGGRQRFKEAPNWASGLMTRLIDAKMVLVNERGHYCYVVEEKKEQKPAKTKSAPAASPASDKNARIVGDDYFPAEEPAGVPAPRWISPQMEAILKQSKKSTKKS